MVLWVYKASLQLQYFASDVLSWQDPRLSIKAILFLSTSLALSFCLGDALTLWLLANLTLFWPLAYKNRRAEIDRLVGLANLKID